MTRVEANAIRLREADVTRQVKDFLQFRGWRLIRNNVTTMQAADGAWVQFGEKGMPDYLALFYLPNGTCQHIWIELKHPKTGITRDKQREWQQREAQRGALVLQVRQFDEFACWYDRTLAWLHTEDWVRGQKAMSFDSCATKRECQPPSSPK